MAFHVGQQVVCIDDNPNDGLTWCKGSSPKIGEIYTIRGFLISPSDGGIPCVRLHEIINRCFRHGVWYENCGYALYRFRPLIEKKTDTGMAILKKIASDVTKKQIIPIKEDAN